MFLLYKHFKNINYRNEKLHYSWQGNQGQQRQRHQHQLTLQPKPDLQQQPRNNQISANNEMNKASEKHRTIHSVPEDVVIKY